MRFVGLICTSFINVMQNCLKVKHETFSLLYRSVNENVNKSFATLYLRLVFIEMNRKSIKEHSKYVTNTDFRCKTF